MLVISVLRLARRHPRCRAGRESWNLLKAWVSNGEPIITVTQSTDQRFAGEASLAIKINNAGFASVTVLGPSAQPGQTITFRIYLPADAGIDWVQPFARSRNQWHGNWKSTGALQLG